MNFLSKSNLTGKVLHRTLATKRYEDLPGPKNYPVVGNLFSLKGFGLISFNLEHLRLIYFLNFINSSGGDIELNPYDNFVKQMNEKYGDLCRWSLLGNREVV